MNYVSPTTAMSHQVKYLERVRSKPKHPSDQDVFALLAEMGTGKSKMILDEWQERVGAGDLQDLLVVAPAGSYRNWFEDKSDLQRAEINIHLDPELRSKMLVAHWQSGGGKAVLDQLHRVLTPKDPSRPRALFVNIEALSVVKDARLAVQYFLEKNKRAMFVVDESTRIKGESERTKAVLRVAPLAAARRILSGLVTPRSPMDLFHQFGFLDWKILGFESWYAFRARYAITKKMEVPIPGKPGRTRRFEIIVGFRRVEELQEKISPYSHRILKEDCLDLEPKTYQIREVALTDEQRKHYKELREYATTQLAGGSHVVAQSVITRIMRLHQICCGHVRDEDGTIHDIKSNRIKELLGVLDEHNGKAVIWTDSTHELEKIVKAIQEEYESKKIVASFWGGNKKDRGEEERRFLGDPECRFMVATQAAGGVGNNWTVANLVVYYSNSYDLELRAQSEDRCHRKGQKLNVTYVDLIAPGTVDRVIVRSLRNKINMATAITGENYREWLV